VRANPIPTQEIVMSELSALVSDPKTQALARLLGDPAAASALLASHEGRLTALVFPVMEAAADYRAIPPVIAAAREIVQLALSEELAERSVLSSPEAVRDYLRVRLGGLGHEVFMVLFLDAQNRLVAAEEMFRGTLTQTSVHPREIVKRALAHNAAGVVFAHNHPSGCSESSRADETLTTALRNALALIDVKVLDHFIVGEGAISSFAERGML
jgi:DNA repair protein RadC